MPYTRGIQPLSITHSTHLDPRYQGRLEELKQKSPTYVVCIQGLHFVLFSYSSMFSLGFDGPGDLIFVLFFSVFVSIVWIA